jgi:hypothetical protein
MPRHPRRYQTVTIGDAIEAREPVFVLPWGRIPERHQRTGDKIPDQRVTQ